MENKRTTLCATYWPEINNLSNICFQLLQGQILKARYQ